jgi:hypothetical protein
MRSAAGDFENTALLETHPFDCAFISLTLFPRPLTEGCFGSKHSVLTCCEVEGVVGGVDGGRRSEDQMRTETRVQLLKV